MKTSMLILLFLWCADVLAGNESIVPPAGGYIAGGTYVIPQGNHVVRIAEENGAWLTVGDNTELIIEGDVRLEGNGFRGCDIIRVTGCNVHIHGTGTSLATDGRTRGGKVNGAWVSGCMEPRMSP